MLYPYEQIEDEHIKVYMLGFNCVRINTTAAKRHDVKTKHTILSIFKKFAEEFPSEALVYVCDNNDGLARNRRIIFSSWFNDVNIDYEQFQSHINYNGDDWYSCMMLKKDIPNKQLFIDAYNFTLMQI